MLTPQLSLIAHPKRSPMPPRRMKPDPAARLTLVLSLLASWTFPITAAAAPRLRCQIERVGTSQVLDFAPAADPYSVPAIPINSRFRFKAVVIGDAQRIQFNRAAPSTAVAALPTSHTKPTAKPERPPTRPPSLLMNRFTAADRCFSEQ